MRKILIMCFLCIICPILPILGQEDTPNEAVSKAKPADPTMTHESLLDAELEVCTGISERMPVGIADDFSVDIGKVFVWCRVTGATDETSIKHVYYYMGQEIASVSLPVKSSSWRTWSSKVILPHWVGQWEIKIFDENIVLLASKRFEIIHAADVPNSPDISLDE